LLLAKKLGVPSSKIIFNGPGKSDKEIEMIIDDDIALVNADSMEELERINQIAKAKGKMVDVGIRVKPDIPEFFVWPKFGMDIATGQAFKAYQKASELKNLNVVGMHAHIGTQICSTRPYTESIRQMANLMFEVNAELEIEFEFFDIGGGFGVPGFTPLFPTEETIENPATIEQFGESIVKTFLSSLSEYNLPEPTMVLEPGRIIITDPALILTMVEGTKVIGGSTKTVVVDAGVNLIMFAPYYYHRIVPVEITERAQEAIDVYGPLCMQMDVLGVNRELPVLKRGDFLAILDAGAYSISLSQQFIRPRPPVILVNGRKKRMVRRGETFGDIFRLDIFSNMV
jgi:diaminopimelate decarboxylase